MHNRLPDQHSIKWIRVEEWKSAGVKSGLLINIQGHNAACFANHRDINLRPRRKRQAAGSAFDCDFPSGSGTEVALIVLIQKQSSGGLAQPLGF